MRVEFLPGWWVMRTPPVFRPEIQKTERAFIRLVSLLAWISALLLLTSVSVTFVAAQESADRTTKQQAEVQPNALSDGTHRPVGKAKKSGNKYDIDRIGQRGIGGGINLFSLERERELGHELAEDIEMQTHLMADPVITEYVNHLGQRIVRNSDAQLPFTIKVIESEEVNAFALPGGYFYVSSGLIMSADSEAELAGLMAHEIAHVAARHATRAETRMQLWTLLSIVLTYVGGPAGGVARAVAGVTAPASFIKFSRDAEREADLLGLEYEYAAGYDPQAVVQFLEKLHSKKKRVRNFIAEAFTTHLMSEDRVRQAQKEISTLLPAKDDYVVDTSEFQEVKARLANLMCVPRTAEDGRPALHRRLEARQLQ